ncbi:hypothetical protein FEM48_Zijuj11G0156300 [Ziziphus jujuba var. spinosa]|uniref:Uncharacterized protein n=1 Tax=Ziziphus jujuba var. spinosa TaxID=714518 RepID=A0A978UJT2_ZIZJJ|nr:hypothetical protein FEM48_Zijuj11G0156300 [Ziziphus jujuba var. spinosa]
MWNKVVFVTWDWPGPDGLESQSGDKTDLPKHLGHFCPALFQCFQPLSLSHPFATSFRFEAIILDLEDVSYQHASHAAVKANPNSAAGETHFNQIVSPKFEGLNLVKRHRLVRRIDRRAPIWTPRPFYRRQDSSLESQPKRRPENWVFFVTVNLSLGHNKLTGKLSENLSLLSKLEVLYLSSNSLIGKIPSSYGNLSSEVLSAGHNYFLGSIPDSFGQLKSLAHLRLGSCNLSGTLPPSIYNLSF